MNVRATARTLAAAMLVATLVTVAQAAPTPAARCDASKIKAAGKAVAARAKCEQKALAKGVAADPACIDSAGDKLADAFTKAEAKGGCTMSGDTTELLADVGACLVDFVGAIDGDDSCSARKVKAVGARTYAASKCWQKGYLAGGTADAACLAAAELKFDSAIAKADSAGTCTDTAAALEALVDTCVENLRTPATTTTTAEPTTTTEEPTTTTAEPTTTTEEPTTTTTMEEPTTTTTSTTDTTTTTTIPVPSMDWVLCAHAGETCVLPRHDQVVSLGGIPPATAWARTVEDKSVECSPEALFPGQPEAHSGDCYFLDVGCSYDAKPIGVIVAGTRIPSDFQSVYVLQDPPLAAECISSTVCDLENGLVADFANDIAVAAVDPRVCGPDDRAHLGYHWILTTETHSTFAIAPHFVPQGITGYRESNLQFSVQSMPNIEGFLRPDWYAYMDITQLPHADFPLTTDPIVTTHRFFFRYLRASYTFSQAENCIYFDPLCPEENLRRAPEGTY